MLPPIAPFAGLLLLSLSAGCSGKAAAPAESAPVVVIPSAPAATATASAPPVDADPPRRQALSGASLFPGDTLHAPLNLVVRIDEKGFTLTTSSGPIAPGCAGLGPGTTIPNVNGEPDWKRLTTCARRLRSARADLQNETTAGIAASPTMTYERVIKTMDALRDSDTAPLFPELHFEVIR